MVGWGKKVKMSEVWRNRNDCRLETKKQIQISRGAAVRKEVHICCSRKLRVQVEIFLGKMQGPVGTLECSSVVFWKGGMEEFQVRGKEKVLGWVDAYRKDVNAILFKIHDQGCLDYGGGCECRVIMWGGLRVEILLQNNRCQSHEISKNG